MAREEMKSNLLGSAARHTWEAFVRMMKDQSGEIDPGDGESQLDANNDSEWDVEGNNPAGLGEEPSTPPDTTPPTQDGEEPSAAEPLKTDDGQTPAKVEGDEQLPFHDHPRWQEVMTELKALKESQSSWEADKENLKQQIQFYAEQYNQVIGKTDEEASGQAIPRVNNTPLPQAGQTLNPQPATPVATQPEVSGQLPPNIIGPATQVDKDGNPVGGWEDQQQIAQYMDHRANEIASKGVEAAYTERIAPVFDRFNQAITSMQDILLNLNFPTEKGKDGKPDPNSGWQPAYDEALKDVFITDDAGKVIAVKNNATLNYWQSQPFPKLAAIEHGMRKLAPKTIQEGKKKAIKGTLEQLNKKPGPTTPSVSSASPQDEVDIGWDTVPGSKQSEDYLNKKGLI